MDFSDLLKDPERNMEWFLSRRATMLIPAGALLREGRRQLDPTLREVDGIFDTVLNSVPGFSESLPTRNNYLGEPIQLETLKGFSAILPFSVSFDKEDTLADEVNRLHSQDVLKFGKMSRNVSREGVSKRLSARDYSNLESFVGTKLALGGQSQRGALNEFVHSSAYDDMTDEERADGIELIVKEFRRAGSEQFKSERPELWLVQ